MKKLSLLTLLIFASLDAQIFTFTANRLRIGTTLPVTCSVGEVFFKSDASAGSNVYGCTSTDTWTVQGGSGTFSGDAGDVPFTPAGGIAASNVQAAVEEVDSEKQAADAQLTTLSTPGATAKMVPTSNGSGGYNHQFVRLRAHATDCTALTDGVEGEACYEQDADTIYVCEPTAGACDTAGEWRSVAGGAGLANVSEDTSPTLGGNLDGGGFAITNLESITLTGDPFLMFPQGAACTPDANSVCVYPAASIATAYGLVLPSAVGSTGVVKVSVSGAVATLSHAAIADADVPNNITIDLAAAATALAADPTDCTDQFARGINASGTAQCANVATADISNNAVTRDKVSAVLRTRQVHFKVWGTGASSVLQDTDDELSIFNNQLGSGITITKVTCECDTGTPTIQLQRDDGSAANILASSLSCATTPASTTSFSGTENQIADGQRIDFLIDAAGGAAHWVAVTVVYTVD